MKAIVLAAGKGTRMRPLTETCPKPLLPIMGKPLIEHIVKQLPKEFDELIIVIGYLGHMIQQYCGEEFLGKKVTYVIQHETKGTFHALKLCKPYLTEGERFLVLFGDDLHGGEALKQCLNYPRAVVVDTVDDPRPYGNVEVDDDGFVINIIEKPEVPKGHLVAAGPLLLDTNIFDFEPPIDEKRGEYFIATAIPMMLKQFPYRAIPSTFWFPVTTPEHLKEAESVVESLAG